MLPIDLFLQTPDVTIYRNSHSAVKNIQSYLEYFFVITTQSFKAVKTHLKMPWNIIFVIKDCPVLDIFEAFISVGSIYSCWQHLFLLAT